MLSPRRAALNSATALVAIAASSARAGDDPFALDPNAAAPPPPSGTAAQRPTGVADQIFFAAVRVNGRELVRMVKLREIDGRLHMARGSVEYAGISPPPQSGEFVDLTRLPGVVSTMDWQAYRLDLSVESMVNSANVVDYSRARTASSARTSPLTALIVDYDLSAQATPLGLRAGGYVSTRVSRSNISAESGWTFATDRAPVRLDTTVQIDDPERMLTLKLGDFIQSSAPEARAVRLGGIQIGSNFGLQPDYISYPLPDFAGELAVPQQIDLIVNDRRLSSENLQAGSFALRNVPVSQGRGKLGVVVRDTLGRERVLALDFYTSRRLLDQGVNQWSLGVGRIRRRFGQSSGDYGPLALSGVLRRGLSRRFTAGLSMEATEGLIGSGVDATATVGGIAELSLGLRASHFNQAGVSRSGRAVNFNLASAGRGASVRVSGRFVSQGFDDIASARGDRAPTSFAALAGSFDLGNIGSVSASVAHEWDTRIDPRGGAAQGLTRSDVASVSFRRNAGRATVFADLSARRANRQTSVAGFIGLTVPLGARSVALVSAYQDNSGSRLVDVSFSRAAVVPGDVGFGLRVQAGQRELVQGQAAYQGEWGRIDSEAELVGGDAAARVSARGALVLAGGSVFAVKDARSGMVVVETGGIKGIALARDNLPVARSRRGGQVLVPGLVPRVPMQVGIVRETLPVGAVAESSTELIAVPGGTVARLDLGIKHYRPVMVRLLDHQGKAFAPGTVVRSLPSGAETIVGFDSMAELNLAGADRQVEVDMGDGSQCLADIGALPDPAGMLPGDTPPVLTCYGRMRSFVLDGHQRAVGSR